MTKIIICMLGLLCSLHAHASQKNDCVILLHGLGRTHYAMFSIEQALKRQHYTVINQTYPSTKQSIDTLANQFIQPMVNQCLTQNPKHILFVTHSLGGIILEKYLERHNRPEFSHIVMLSPPHHGSPLADYLQHTWIYKIVTGPAGQELTTQYAYNEKPLPANIRIGVIAGTLNFIPFSNYFFHGENDGKVSVSSAHSDNISDFIVLPVNHAIMMHNPRVHQYILTFLHTGRF